MNQHPIDNAFRHKLHDHEVVVPEGTWSEISKRIDSRKKRRAAAWWMPGALVLMGAVTGLVIDQLLIPSPSITEKVSLKKEAPDASTAQVASISFEEPSETSQVAISGDSKPGSESKGHAIKLNTPREIESTPGGQNAPDLPDPVTNTSPEALKPATSFIQKKKNNSALFSALTVEHSDVSRSSFVVSDLSSAIEPLPIELDNDITVVDCYSFGKRSSGTWLFEAFAGPTYSLKSMDSREEDVSDYISGRDSTETAQISMHAGFRFGYQHQSGITAKTGFNYTLVNELFQLEFRTSGTRIDTLFDNNGNIISIDTVDAEGVRTVQTQNRYHAIDIPLLIGYRIDNGNWDFGIQAGPVFNIAFNAVGDMINNNGEAFSFSDVSDPNYQETFADNVGIGMYVGVYASKRIGSNIWVFAEPHLHHRFKSITLPDFPIDQRQTNLSLSLGIRYYFGQN